jgi:uncharacterized protein YigE (DUF2233 family)
MNGGFFYTMKKTLVIKCAFTFLAIILFSFIIKEDNNLSYIADPKTQNIQLFWKNDTGHIGSIKNLKALVESKKQKLIFAMNGGMYMEDHSPLGLFIQDHELIRKLNTSKASGDNFHMEPNGVFYLTDKNEAMVCQTSEFKFVKNIKCATQSGPMLIVNGKIHSAFKEGSENLNIRNGVGILPNGKILFAMSKNVTNFYDFAKYFKDKGCKNALYLDGFVCRTYLPEKNWEQTDGNFGIIIGITK